MPERDKRMLKDLECSNPECSNYDHPFVRAEIWQTLHTVAYSNEIKGISTPKGALDNITCPKCGSPPKDPNDPYA
jgi:hypothetical protein